MPKKAKIGDIIEIPTRKGLAYVQFSHYHDTPPRMGAVIRILPGFFLERPAQLQSLADKKELYYTLFPVQAIVNRNILAVIGNANVPDYAKKFPLFRAGIANTKTGNVDQWWLWDGVKEWKIDKITDEQLDLPIRQGWNDRALIERIEQGWTPRKAESFIQAARLKERFKKHSSVRGVKHFVLFRKLDDANQAKDLFKAKNLDSSVCEHGTGFTLIIPQNPPYSEEYIENFTVLITEVATECDGIYDGRETEVG